MTRDELLHACKGCDHRTTTGMICGMDWVQLAGGDPSISDPLVDWEQGPYSFLHEQDGRCSRFFTDPALW